MEYGWRANKGIIEGLLKQAGETRNIPLGLSASEWSEGVKTGRWTAVDVTVHCLEQMLKYDSTLNAMISVSPDSIEAARRADKDYRRLLALQHSFLSILPVKMLLSYHC